MELLLALLHRTTNIPHRLEQQQHNFKFHRISIYDAKVSNARISSEMVKNCLVGYYKPKSIASTAGAGRISKDLLAFLSSSYARQLVI